MQVGIFLYTNVLRRSFMRHGGIRNDLMRRKRHSILSGIWQLFPLKKKREDRRAVNRSALRKMK